jgi:hypothetical protein
MLVSDIQPADFVVVVVEDGPSTDIAGHVAQLRKQRPSKEDGVATRTGVAGGDERWTLSPKRRDEPSDDVGAKKRLVADADHGRRYVAGEGADSSHQCPALSRGEVVVLHDLERKTVKRGRHQLSLVSNDDENRGEAGIDIGASGVPDDGV